MANRIYLYIGILSYLLMGITMYLLGYRANKHEQFRSSEGKGSSANFYVILSILFFSLMCGLRYRTGADCESYALAYEGLKNGNLFATRRQSELEPLFVLLSNVFAYLKASRVVFLGSLALMQIAFFYSSMRTRLFLLPFLGLVLILGPHFLSWNNGMRQVIASCIFVYATVELLDKNSLYWGRFFLWVFIASLMHKSALMLIPLALVRFYDLKPNKWISLIFILIAVYYGRVGLPLNSFGWGEELLRYLNYDDYSSRFDYYLDQDATILNYGPRRILLLLTYIFIVLFSDKLDRKFKGDRLYRVAYLFFLVYVCGTEALISQPILFIRPFNYFHPFVLICSAYCLYYLVDNKKTFWLWIGIVLMCSYSIINSIAEAPFPEEFAVYKFIFFHP